MSIIATRTQVPSSLTYRDNAAVGDIVKAWQAEHEPVYDFVSDGVAQTVWVIDCPETIKKLSSLFAGIDSLSIADGHHRAASAVKVGKKAQRAESRIHRKRGV